uniref:Chromo domain-containing protein n=1 Tax=Chromera velia CCMP2878 TaxID=1169474 RepID=A0A0G4HPX3_9ALVE|eukprot:Cvel_7898.t1-p1 / transcript=Cvel_7898.t1 / gene=Cvel_7898 / organism=Chromera_velia_CCMP2878 / gene_product=hypothetical protein / transcript_product=hypothetical protein / location=Cvel_scaffold423:58592-59340(+) / protein_length=192 / sequence_SO=supercontig / SO=protein_coding / is_pseudo=false
MDGPETPINADAIKMTPRSLWIYQFDESVTVVQILAVGMKSGKGFKHQPWLYMAAVERALIFFLEQDGESGEFTAVRSVNFLTTKGMGGFVEEVTDFTHDDERKRFILSAATLQRFEELKQVFASPPSEEYEVEAIRGWEWRSPPRRRKRWFRIKWKGWPEADNTDEPEENLTGSPRILAAFLQARNDCPDI